MKARGETAGNIQNLGSRVIGIEPLPNFPIFLPLGFLIHLNFMFQPHFMALTTNYHKRQSSLVKPSQWGGEAYLFSEFLLSRFPYKTHFFHAPTLQRGPRHHRMLFRIKRAEGPSNQIKLNRRVRKRASFSRDYSALRRGAAT